MSTPLKTHEQITVNEHGHTEFSFSQAVEEEAQPFIAAANEEDLAQRVRKLQDERAQATRALASCRRELGYWADVERRNRMRLQDTEQQLTELGAL